MKDDHFAGGGPVIRMTSLCAGYGNGPVLDNLSVSIAGGSIYALLGGNGSGKSTTLAVLLGILRPSGGQVMLSGVDPVADPEGARRKCAHVAENVALYPHLTALENLEYFLSLAGQRARPDALQQSLDEVGLARQAWNRRLSGYSKGMRQKVAIALALQRDVPVLLLDEPTSGLDPGTCEEFHRLLLALREKGRTSLMVTHDLLGAATIADTLGLMANGRIGREIDLSAGRNLDLQELQRQLGYRRE